MKYTTYYCHIETDHTAPECALAPSKPQQVQKEEPKKDFNRAKSERSSKVCYSWNDGRCSVLYCRYRHICAKCQGDHKALYCGAYPASRPAQPMKVSRREGEGARPGPREQPVTVYMCVDTLSLCLKNIRLLQLISLTVFCFFRGGPPFYHWCPLLKNLGALLYRSNAIDRTIAHQLTMHMR